MCTTRNKRCLFDDIIAENYFLEVLSNTTIKYCSNEIEILADGTWRIYEEIKGTKNKNSTPDNVKPIDSVDLDRFIDRPSWKSVLYTDEFQQKNKYSKFIFYILSQF